MLQTSGHGPRSKQRAWRILVPSLEVPGDHLTMVEEPHVAELAEKLTEAFATLRGNGARPVSEERVAVRDAS